METQFTMSTIAQSESTVSLVEKILFEYADPKMILDNDDLDLVEQILRRYA